jgi:hypothetical protein
MDARVDRGSAALEAAGAAEGRGLLKQLRARLCGEGVFDRVTVCRVVKSSFVESHDIEWCHSL